MGKTAQLNAAVLGASGYTGASAAPSGHASQYDDYSGDGQFLAGRRPENVFHLNVFDGEMVRLEDADFSTDIAFSCLPHGTSQDAIAELPSNCRVVDCRQIIGFAMLTSMLGYGREHLNAEATRNAIYGLTEFARPSLKDADLVACPGCYPTATLLCLLPVAAAGVISKQNIIIDAKSGVSGAGRGLKEGNLFCEAAEGLHSYAVGTHRHAPEIEQELATRFGADLTVTFTPHLVPMTRGELVTIYAELSAGETVETVHAALSEQPDESFVRVRPLGDLPPDTRHVRGTIVAKSRSSRIAPKAAIIIGAIDNLIKGSSGQPCRMQT